MKNDKDMKNKEKVIKILATDYGMLYFDEAFIELVDETIEWYKGNVEKSVQSIVEKYDLQELSSGW